MRRRMLTALAACAVLSAALGCETTADRDGDNAAIIGANAAFTPSPDGAAARPLNANISREEFDRDRGYYEAEARRLRSTVGPGADDLWLWWRTRSALAAAEDVRDLTINVDVDNNVVTLTGTVGSAAQKDRAEQVARGVGGIKDVMNRLTVGRL